MQILTLPTSSTSSSLKWKFYDFLDDFFTNNKNCTLVLFIKFSLLFEEVHQREERSGKLLSDPNLSLFIFHKYYGIFGFNIW